MKLPIYLDGHASTPVDERVVEAMLPYFTEKFGNSASAAVHSFGWDAEIAVNLAREQTASLLNCSPTEIIFTGGATESDNLAIRGVAEAYKDQGDHIITSQTEHPAVLQTCEFLEKRGIKVTYLPVDKYGIVDPDDVRKAITNKTILITIMAANNEIGTIAPLKEIGRIAGENEIIFHSDAVQIIGKLPFDVKELNVNIASLTAHKMYGPKGAGALFISKKEPRVKIDSIVFGGGHEKGIRSGTLNIPGIVGLGKACELNKNEMESDAKKIKKLRDKLYKKITDNLDEVYLNGHPEKRLPNNLNLAFKYVEGASILMEMREVAMSSSSACSSETVEAGHVLKAIKVDKELELSAIRIGLHKFTTEEQIEYSGNRLIEVVKELRNMSPLL